MENETAIEERPDKPSKLMITVRIILTLLFPFVFFFAMTALMSLGEDSGLFYLNTATTVLIILGVFPLSLAYLIISFISKKKAIIFAVITAAISIILLVTSAVMSSMAVSPLIDIDKNFIAPTKAAKKANENITDLTPGPDMFGCPFLATKCPEVYSSWSISNQHLTIEDLQNIAKENDWENTSITTEECRTYIDKKDCVLATEVNEVKVRLRYINSKYDEDSELRLYLSGKNVAQPDW